MKKSPSCCNGKFIAVFISLISGLFLLNTVQKSYAQTQRKNEIKKEETFTRPKPQTPVQPQVPSMNRYQQDKVFLEFADSLYRRRPVNLFDTVERQVLMGNVKFRQGGMWMFCDSAYYYPEDNSLDAFSNVRMEQGDTLFVYADKVFYNGNSKMAYLKNGPTRQKVKLINRNTTLITDSLDYDLQNEIGWFSRWGTLEDNVNTLTSLYGQYSPRTKLADFYHDVFLENKKDGYTLLTDTLHYSTRTNVAEINTRTEIRSANDTIITTLAEYNTKTGNAKLMSRSVILHRDSAGNVTTLEGDSIIYDNMTRISRVYMYRNPSKRSYPMILTDTAQKTTLIGGYGQYNDRTKEALATIYPLLIEYSQGDSIFLRADTIKTFTYIANIPVYKFRINTLSGYPEFNGLPIVKIDSLTYKIWIDTIFFKDKPLLFDEIFKRIEAQLPPPRKEEVITVPLPDNEMLGEIIDAEDSLQQKETEKDIKKIPEFVPDSIQKEFHIAYAYHRGRFFKQDLQGVADSLVLIEQDSMLYMFRKPIIWSGERQVTGNRIDVHFNDSTADWAHLPESGLISELVDEDFYNQITGKDIMAYFEGQTLRHMNVSGNVETIFLPQESDSTFNRLVNAESSYLDVYLKDNKMEKLKMWPEVNGSVTPLFLVKQNQKYLQRFRWWGKLRPERAWYGDRWHWVDNLGEIPEELERYFLSPSDFGEPKSFPSVRNMVVIPSTQNLSETTTASGSETPVTPENNPAMQKVEESLTGEGIEEGMQQMENLEEETEKQTRQIERAIETEIRENSEENEVSSFEEHSRVVEDSDNMRIVNEAGDVPFILRDEEDDDE